VSFLNRIKRIFSSTRKDYVLVAGAAHIDILADYRSMDQPRMDKIGSILYSVGGTAYNIAINLAQSGVPVSLLTVLKKNSFSSTWICERLKSTGVDFDLIDFSEKVRESGFVALRTDGVLNTAVTSTAVGEHSFPPHLIDQAVLNARIVVIDCNLATDQMSLLLNCAMKHNRPTVVAAVSDSKFFVFFNWRITSSSMWWD
jgi:sugar/nucleoside kinase (ribokinase family)